MRCLRPSIRAPGYGGPDPATSDMALRLVLLLTSLAHVYMRLTMMMTAACGAHTPSGTVTHCCRDAAPTAVSKPSRPISIAVAASAGPAAGAQGHPVAPSQRERSGRQSAACDPTCHHHCHHHQHRRRRRHRLYQRPPPAPLRRHPHLLLLMMVMVWLPCPPLMVMMVLRLRMETKRS